MIDKLLESLPLVAEAVAQPLAKTERIVMISGGNGDSGGVGASRLTRDITNIVSQLPAVVEALTGIDILGMLKNLTEVGSLTERGAEHTRSGEESSIDADSPAQASD